jgi:hypothetical protein
MQNLLLLFSVITDKVLFADFLEIIILSYSYSLDSTAVTTAMLEGGDSLGWTLNLTGTSYLSIGKPGHSLSPEKTKQCRP